MGRAMNTGVLAVLAALSTAVMVCGEEASSVAAERDALVLLIKNGNTAGATAAWDKLIAERKSDPALPAATGDIAKAWWQHRDWARARDTYQYIVAQWPQSEAAVAASAGAAVACLKVKDPNGADAAVKALEAHPAAQSLKASALVKVGEEYAAQRYGARAESLLDEAIAWAADDAEGKGLKLRALCAKGLVATQARDEAKVQAAIERIEAAYTPAEASDSLVAIAKASRDEGLYEKARATFGEALAGKQGTSAGLPIETELVKVDMAAGDKEAALAGVNRVVVMYATDPGLPQAVRKLATEWRRRGLGTYEEIAEISAEKVKGISRLRALAEAACIYLDSAPKKTDAIIETMKKEAKGNPEGALCLMPIASRYLDLMDTGRAAPIFRWVKEEQSNAGGDKQSSAAEPAFYSDLCDILLSIREESADPEAALAKLCEEYADRSELPDAMLKVVMACRNSGLRSSNSAVLAQGRQVGEATIEQYATWSGLRMVYSATADCMTAAKEYPQAIECLLKAVDKYPDKHARQATYRQLARVYEQAGADDKAAATYLKAVEAEPDISDGWRCLRSAAWCTERMARAGRMSETSANEVICDCYSRALDYSSCPPELRETILAWLESHNEGLTVSPRGEGW